MRGRANILGIPLGCVLPTHGAHMGTHGATWVADLSRLRKVFTSVFQRPSSHVLFFELTRFQHLVLLVALLLTALFVLDVFICSSSIWSGFGPLRL